MNALSLLETFIEFGKNERQFSGATLANYRTDIRQFGQFCDVDVRQITLDHLRAWHREMHKRKLSQASINRKVHALVTFWDYLMIADIVKESVPRRLSKTLPKRARPHNIHYLSTKQLKRFVSQPAECTRDRVAWHMLAWLGLRRQELVNLNCGDIDLTHNLVQILNSKGGVSRTLPIPKPIRTEIAALVHGFKPSDPLFRERMERWTANQMYRAFNRHIIRAGCEGITPHTLRHTFATHLVMRGVPVDRVKTLMGHRDLKTTMMYVHYSQDHLNAAIKNHPLNELED